MSKKQPTEFSAYLVTHSDNDAMPVGTVLIDKGRRLHAEWNTMNFKTGEQTFTAGERLTRLCATCRIDHKRVGILGHDGECGSEPVIAEGQQVIADATKRALG